MAIIFKDPDSKLDFHVDWTDWVEPGDFLTGSAWVVPAGLVEELPAPSMYVGPETDVAGMVRTVQRTTIWLSGGSAGQEYQVVNRISTAHGRIADRTINIRMREK